LKDIILRDYPEVNSRPRSSVREDSRPRLSDPHGLADMLLYRINRLRAVGGGIVLRYCEGAFGVTRREWVLMALLESSGIVSSSELAAHARLDKSATSKAVNTLAKKGLISRTPRRGDRRYTEIALTTEGRDLYRAIVPIVAGINRQIMAPLSESEISLLDDMLDRMQRSANELMDAGPDLPLADRRHGGTTRFRPAVNRSAPATRSRSA
jgi:DNA-binding MarR family transcriptional regulator